MMPYEGIFHTFKVTLSSHPTIIVIDSYFPISRNKFNYDLGNGTSKDMYL